MAFTHKNVTELLKRIQNDKEKYSNFVSLYCLQRGISQSNDWDRIMALSPANSVLNKIIEVSRSGTDFPHQIAFFGLMHYLSGYLLSKDIHIDIDGQKIYPDIWSIILAPSGSGKSSIESFLSKVFADVDIKKVEPFATSKAYLENLRKTPKGLLVKDEWAQLLMSMEQQTYLAELKDYFLKTYDNADITRTTSKESIGVKEPAISIYGSTVDETFTKYVTAEMMLDGFAQRFSYCFCDTRKDKKALLTHNSHIEELKKEISKVLDSIHHIKYTLSKKAIKKYEELFDKNLKMFDGIAYSFFRRTNFKTIKYALLYHVILRKESNIIDEEDIILADRITFSHLIDLKKLLQIYDEGKLINLIDKCIEIKNRLKERDEKFTPRSLVQYTNGKVKNIAEAKILYELIIKIDETK